MSTPPAAQGNGILKHLVYQDYSGVRPVLQLVISDVPGNHRATIASGPLVAQDDVLPPADGLPAWLVEQLHRAPGRPDVHSLVQTTIVADNARARAAVRRRAEALGLVLRGPDQPLAGDALEAGAAIAEQLLGAPSGLYLWGGETTVRLPPEPGQGGRNQALALAAARHLAGRPDLFLLAVGSDGTDGPTEDAGALVDGCTLARGAEAGLDAQRYLARADSGRYLAATGDLINTGPTGTNVMDLVLGLRL